MEYKTSIQYTYWYEDITTLKKLLQFKIAIWSKSSITKWNTIINTSVNLWWRQYSIVYDDLWRTDYVQRIMQLKNTDNNKNVIVDMPIWYELLWWNWIWYIDQKYKNFSNEFLEWNKYEPKVSRDSNEITKFTIWKYWIIWVPYDIDWELFNIEIITLWSDKLEFWGSSAIISVQNAETIRMENVLTVHDFTDNWLSGEPLTNNSWIDNWFDT